ncbi:hypothetical protein KAX02_03045 [candidate division WOR-3 bacterium]|nr:hypothetical protein [candidate division WOR-3 bacterium]
MYQLKYPNHDEIIGMRFGRLIVSKYSHKKRKHYYICACDCGNIKVVSRDNLLGNYTKSCGCWHKENGIKTGKKNRTPKGNAALNSLYKSYIREAKRKKVSFDLSKKDFKYITKQNCYYCCAIPKNYHCHSGIYGGYTYNGIDRKDNNLGYEKANCVPCCKRCNQMKNDMTMKEFINQIININNKLRII